MNSPGWPRGMAAAHAKWSTGIYMLWYPVKERRATDALADHVARVAMQAAKAGACASNPVSRRRPRVGTGLGGAFDRQSALDAGWGVKGARETAAGGAGRFRIETVRI